jgi:type IV pilus biogenesis/stability protein PilW
VKIKNILLLILIFLSSCATTGENVRKASAHYKIGLSYFYENKIQSAFVEFQKALELNPEDKDALNGLGLVYIKFGNFQKARESFIEAVNIDPDFSDAHNNLGVTYINMGKWSEAVDSFKKALKNPFYKTPENAYYNIGNAYYRLGLFDDAINAYNEAIKRMQNFHLPYYGLALCYNAKGRYGDAASAMTRAIELDPVYKGNKDKTAEDLKEKKLKAKGDEEKDIIDYIEILKY